MTKKYKGHIEKSEIEGGNWILRTEQGETFQLDSSDEKLFRSGMAVTADGEIRRDMMSIGMMGPVLKIKNWEKA